MVSDDKAMSYPHDDLYLSGKPRESTFTVMFNADMIHTAFRRFIFFCFLSHCCFGIKLTCCVDSIIGWLTEIMLGLLANATCCMRIHVFSSYYHLGL
jgi:hypothetical protein